MAYYPVLAVTDGTTTVPFLAQGNGLYLVKAAFGRPQIKGGGNWKDSSLSDGRRLALARFTNVSDAYTLGVRGYAQDDIAYHLQNLSRLLEAARNYWTAGELINNAPVYVERQGGREANIEYATVLNYNIPNDPDFFSQPLINQLNTLATEDVTLDIEHRIWSENPPGLAAGTAVQKSATQVFNGVTYGRAATTANEVFVANRHNNANITNIWRFDASVPSYTALFGAALPYDLLPAVPAAGDILYCGSDNAVADSGPFSNVIFDISIAQANITTIVFEYWNGAWVAIPNYADETNSFRNTGVRSFNFEQPNDWTTTAINGVTAWWIRFRVTVVGGGPTPPRQANRQPYATTWPAVAVAAAQVGGDITALARFKFYTYSYAGGGLGTQQTIYRMTAGLRAAGRGAAFRSYLNAADEQNFTGLSIFLGGTSAPVYATAAKAPTGRAVRYNPAGASDGLVAFRLETALTGQFNGTFRAYARVYLNSAVTDCSINLRVQFNYNSPNAYYWRSPDFYPANNVDFLVIDFGQIQIPGTAVKPGEVNQTDLTLTILNGTGNPNLYVYDLILIPVDEWGIDAFNPGHSVMPAGTLLDIDSLTSPRRQVYADVLYASTSLKDSDYVPVSGGPAILQPNLDQKLYCFFQSWVAASSVWQAYPNLLGSLLVYRNQRYLGWRGAR